VSDTGSADPPAPRRCRATTTAGRPCKAYALTGSLYCGAHDPDRRAEHVERSRRGGAASWARRAVLPVAETPLGPIAERLAEIADRLAGREECDVPRLRAATYALATRGRCLETGSIVADLERIETRLDEVERAAVRRDRDQRAAGW